MIELAGLRGDEHQHVAIDARRAATLGEYVFRFKQRFRAIATIVRVLHPQNHGAHAAGLIRDLG